MSKIVGLVFKENEKPAEIKKPTGNKKPTGGKKSAKAKGKPSDENLSAPLTGDGSKPGEKLNGNSDMGVL